MRISPSVERQRERSSPFQRTMETPDNHQTPCKNQDFKENFSHTLFLFVGTRTSSYNCDRMEWLSR